MKKLFTLVAMLVLTLGIVSNAKCYIVGNAEGNSWNPQVGVELTETSTSGVYSGEVEITGDGFFGVADMLLTNDDWTYFNANCRYNAQSSNYPVTLNSEMTMTKGGSDYAWKIDLGTYTFTVNFNTNTLIVSDGSGDPVTPTESTWCLVGGFNDWMIGKPAPEFTKVSDGVYELTIDELGGEFKIAKDHSWSTNYGSNGSDVENGVEYSMTLNGNNLKFANETVYTDCKLTLTITDAGASLLVNGTAKEAVTEFEEVYVIGNMNDWTFTNSDYKLTRESADSKIYKGSVTMVAASTEDNYCYWRIYEQLNQIGSWGLAEAQETPSDITSATLVRGTENAITTLPGTYDVTFNLETGELSLVKQENGEDPITPTPTGSEWSLIGGFNSWDLATALEFNTVSEGVYQLTVAELGGEFKIVKDNSWDVNYGSNGSNISNGVEYSLALDGTNLKFANEVGYTDCTLTLKVTDNGATLLVNGTEKEAVTEFEELYVIGNMNNWDFTNGDHKLTRVAADSKVYQGTITMIAAEEDTYCYWRIYEQLNQIGSWGLAEAQETPSDITATTLVRGTENAITTLPGTYDVTFNLETGELSLSATTAPSETVWCLVGGFNNWDVAGAPEFTKVSDGVYEISVAELGGQFKIASDHSWNDNNYGSNGSALTIGTDYTLALNASSNISFENEDTYTDCKLTLTITAEGATLYAEGTLKPATTELTEIYVIGDMNSWNFTDSSCKLTQEAEGSKTYTGKIKFTAAEGNEYCYWRIYEQLNQIGSWGLAEEQEIPSDITSATLVRTSEVAITTLPGEYNVTFNLETGELNLVAADDSVDSVVLNNCIKVVNGSIIAPQNAEIYNINGVRVNGENLDTGLYIVKTADNAVKVLVK